MKLGPWTFGRIELVYLARNCQSLHATGEKTELGPSQDMEVEAERQRPTQCCIEAKKMWTEMKRDVAESDSRIIFIKWDEPVLQSAELQTASDTSSNLCVYLEARIVSLIS